MKESYTSTEDSESLLPHRSKGHWILLPAGLAVERCRLGEHVCPVASIELSLLGRSNHLKLALQRLRLRSDRVYGCSGWHCIGPLGCRGPSVSIQISKESGGASQSTSSDENGRFVIQLLPPGSYRLKASKIDFRPLIVSHLYVYVTETLRLELHLQLVEHAERSEVSSSPQMLQTSNSALGRIVNEAALQGLPLATRNFAQIIGLSPGVSVGVYNAGELGLGGIALSQISPSNDGVYVHGARSYDNNYQMDGISVSDVQGSAAGSGGIPIPNPDSIQEFKVQTALYDAGFGRYGGANVSLVTKAGGNDFHGNAFEFLRNEVLNANDFFLNQTGQPRAILKQNQFGVAFGGPIREDRLLFFGSYQGTRQVNGLAAGQSRIACAASLAEPPLTDDRSATAIGQLFGGMKGALGGAAVNQDGSNINPVALALLNLRLSGGSFLIPTPQTVDPSKPFFSQGFSVFSSPCHFDENQFSTNLDYILSSSSKLAARFFFADDDQTVTFPGNGVEPVRQYFRVSNSRRFRLSSSLRSLTHIRLATIGSTRHEWDMSATGLEHELTLHSVGPILAWQKAS